MRNKIITSFFCLLLAVSALIGLLMPDRYYSEREKRTLTQSPNLPLPTLSPANLVANWKSILPIKFPCGMAGSR